MDYSDRINKISEKLKKVLEESEELKRIVNQRQSPVDSPATSVAGDTEEVEEEVTYYWCCCFRKEKLN
jgi:hypothetical protein